MGPHQRWQLWLSVLFLILLSIDGSDGLRRRRYPRNRKTKRSFTSGDPEKSDASIPSENGSIIPDEKSALKEKAPETLDNHSPVPKLVTQSDSNLNSTRPTQMSDKEATDALIYIIIFLVLYTSSIGMLILYNVNHHKKIVEHEEIKTSQREYERSRQLIELQKREEVYLHYKALYGQDSGGTTPMVEESRTSTPEPRAKKFFQRSFSLREVPKFTRKLTVPALQGLVRSATLSKDSELPKPKARAGRFSFRPRRGKPGELAGERSPKRKRQFSVRDPDSESSNDDDDYELSTQTWHPSMMTREDKKMVEDVKNRSEEKEQSRRYTEPEVSRVIVLKKNLKSDCKSASAEEVQPFLHLCKSKDDSTESDTRV